VGSGEWGVGSGKLEVGSGKLYSTALDLLAYKPASIPLGYDRRKNCH